MAWVQKLPSGKYRALYRDPHGAQRSAGSFTHKKMAENEGRLAESKSRELGWRDPRAGRRPWGEWCAEWWPTRPVEPGTLARDTSPRDKHLMPKWETTALAAITRHDVKAWAADLGRTGLAPASVRRIVHLFSASLTAAVDKEILATNVALRLDLPSGQIDPMRFLSSKEAGLVLDQFRDEDRPFASLLFGTGVRWGEGAGLQTRRVDLERMSLRVAEVWDDKIGRLKAYPKGRRIRDVPIPEWVAQELEGLMGKPDHLIFGPLIYTNWRKRVWMRAVEDSEIGHLRPHDARHTYASWLIADGMSLFEVGTLLGHESPSTTQRYAHLVPITHARVSSAVSDPRVANV